MNYIFAKCIKLGIIRKLSSSFVIIDLAFGV